MKRLFLILPLAACAPHIDPCLRPCNPIVEYCPCAEVSGSDRGLHPVAGPDRPTDGADNGGGSSDDAGDVSEDSNGENSDD